MKRKKKEKEVAMERKRKSSLWKFAVHMLVQTVNAGDASKDAWPVTKMVAHQPALKNAKITADHSVNASWDSICSWVWLKKNVANSPDLTECAGIVSKAAMIVMKTAAHQLALKNVRITVKNSVCA